MIGWLRRLFGARHAPLRASILPSTPRCAWVDVVTERQASKQGDPLLYCKSWCSDVRGDAFEFDSTIDVQPIPKASK